MVLKNGSFRTFDNEDGNSVVWNPSTQLYDFTYSVGGSEILRLEVQSISCATPSPDSGACACTVPLNLNTAFTYSSMTAGSVLAEPTCPANYPTLKTTSIKWPTETTDAPTDVIIRCMASKWIACRKSTLESWMISDAACIQP
ncbi:hypothetical protein PRIPAC_81145 [Pristionchus pacificus]|uniref:Uncharacterized protein n=1 Tax=Pristionchus pacificus TaxID=54126 RepID=A0A454XKV9_PRIPA|nr:hypothetical protein PRIPAC_81145 [Pristionchus pacificus]|eukprot:PDM72633.1 hypothetical protein PRIPAC_39067 [Pristionchus pacificus]